MARPLTHTDEPELDTDQVQPESTPLENASIAHWATSRAPWWAISVIFHTLAIVLLSLITMSIGRLTPVSTIITKTIIKPSISNDLANAKPEPKLISDSPYDVPETDPNSNEYSKIVVPPDIQARLSNHWETNNPELPDTHGAHGFEEAHVFYDPQGVVDKAGGGGMDGISFTTLIGAGGSDSPGTGGGWGGGTGTGMGPDNGSGRGSFGRPDQAGREWLIKRFRGSKAGETSVSAALEWLAKHQEVDGHWDCVKYGGKQADVASTGLAMLAFLGHGNTEKIGPYRDNVQRAVYWLISIQNPDGSYYKQGETHGIGYHHAIAGLAMVEAAGMGNVAETIKSAQLGVNYSIDKHQNGEGSDRLGWRYNAKQEGDLSVSGWFIMQLKSAKMAKLKVDPAAIQGALRFLDRVEQKAPAGESYGGHRYGYKEPTSVGHRRTAIGCLSRQFMGWKREELQGGVAWFMDQGGVPEWGANGGSVDLYYWYYGSLATFQQDAPKGPLWTRWNEAMKKTLCENQRKGGDENGSWDPVGSYSDYWGRVGQTALSALCLEVYYRYNLMCKD